MEGKENFRFYKFMEAVAEGLVSNVVMDIKEQHRNSVGRGHYTYRQRVQNRQECHNIPVRCVQTNQNITGKSKKFTAVS
jgi:hypothetical protein